MQVIGDEDAITEDKDDKSKKDDEGSKAGNVEGKADAFLEMIGYNEVKKTEKQSTLLWFSDAVYLGESGFFNQAKLRHGLGVMIY